MRYEKTARCGHGTGLTCGGFYVAWAPPRLQGCWHALHTSESLLPTRALRNGYRSHGGTTFCRLFAKGLAGAQSELDAFPRNLDHYFANGARLAGFNQGQCLKTLNWVRLRDRISLPSGLPRGRNPSRQLGRGFPIIILYYSIVYRI